MTRRDNAGHLLPRRVQNTQNRGRRHALSNPPCRPGSAKAMVKPRGCTVAVVPISHIDTYTSGLATYSRSAGLVVLAQRRTTSLASWCWLMLVSPIGPQFSPVFCSSVYVWLLCVWRACQMCFTGNASKPEVCSTVNVNIVQS